MNTTYIATDKISNEKFGEMEPELFAKAVDDVKEGKVFPYFNHRKV